MRLFADLHRACRRHAQQLVHASMEANADAYRRGQADLLARASQWLDERATAYRLDAQHPPAPQWRKDFAAAVSAELHQVGIDLTHTLHNN